MSGTEIHSSKTTRYPDQEQTDSDCTESVVVVQETTLVRPDEVVCASSPDSLSGDEADAERSFPLTVDAAAMLVQDLWKEKVKALTLTVAGEAADLKHRDLRAIWNSLSASLVGSIGLRHVVVMLPLDGTLTAIKGVFGCPTRVGQSGDDHWAVQTCEASEDGIRLTLRRLGSPEERRRLANLRTVGAHVTVYPVWVGRRLQAKAFGFINHPDGRRESRIVIGPKLANPSSANAEALAMWLDSHEGSGPVTVWASDGLVAAAVRGFYANNPAHPYNGVSVPDMHMALSRLQRAIGRTGLSVTVHRAKRSAAVAKQIVTTAIALPQRRNSLTGIEFTEVGYAR